MVDKHPCEIRQKLGTTTEAVAVSPSEEKNVDARALLVLAAFVSFIAAPGLATAEEPPHIQADDTAQAQGPGELAEPSAELAPDEDGATEEEESVEEAAPEQEPTEAWHRRVPAYPWFELSLAVGAFWRDFQMPIDPDVDTEARSSASLATSGAGEAILGGALVFFPFAASPAVRLRGLGLEGAVASVVGMDLSSAGGGALDPGYLAFDVGALYRLAFGSVDVGADVDFRFGWHRTKFDISARGNDLIPPYVYETVRFGAALRVPLGTRHLSVVVSGAYLLVADVGAAVEAAYNESGTTPGANGGEVGVGLLGRMGGLELGLRWTGRWLVSTNHGVGRGFGIDPTTISDMGGNGILSTGDAVDAYNTVQVTLGYRHGARPGSQRLRRSTRDDGRRRRTW